MNNSLLIEQDQFMDNIYPDGEEMGQKILITYSTQFGSTAEIAESITAHLSQEGIAAESRWIKDVDSLSDYDAVVIGSPIQYDRWKSEATNFVLANEKTLANMPVAYYFTCLALADPSPKAKKQAQAHADKLRAISSYVKPVSVGQFAGVLDRSRMPFFYRVAFAGFTAVTGIQQGDYRDWEAIHSWTQETYTKLVVGQSNPHSAGEKGGCEE